MERLFPIYYWLSNLSGSDWIRAVAFFGIAVQLFGVTCLFIYYFRDKPKPLTKMLKGAPAPGLSVIKPCHSCEDNEEENFRQFFVQDYPGPLQLIFVVSTLQAPIVPLLRRLLAENPDFDAQIVVSKTRKAFWKKVDALYDAHQVAKHPYVIWSDSDVIVDRSYLSQMASSLLEPGVSVVTTPQYDRGANNFGSAVKTLANNCDVATLIMIYNAFNSKKRSAFGQSLGFNKAEFDSFSDAWPILNRFLADDQALPYIFFKHGKRVEFRNIYCPVHFAGKSIKSVYLQKIRWLMPQRIAVGNRLAYLAGILVYPTVAAFAQWLTSDFSLLSSCVLLAALASRTLVSLVFESLVVGSPEATLKYFWTIPIWDLSQVYFFMAGFFKESMHFDGKEYRVVDQYYLEEVGPDLRQPSYFAEAIGKLFRD